MHAPHRDEAQIAIPTSPPGPAAQRWLKAYHDGAAPSTYLYPFVWDVSRWANGPFCSDPDGNIFLDFYTHVASAPLGYNHPRIIDECGVAFDPIKTADHDSYLAVGADPDQPAALTLPAAASRFATAAHLQRKLLSFSSRFGLDTTFFVNSGAEAVENGIKIALHRKWREVSQRWSARLLEDLCRQLYIPHQSHLRDTYANYPLFGIAMYGAFHGRILGALSLTNSRATQR